MGYFYPENEGARAVLACTALVFMAMFAYELALLSYEPKERPLQFFAGAVFPYRPFLAVWTVLTLIAGVAVIGHRYVYTKLCGISFLRANWQVIVLTAMSLVVTTAAVEGLLHLVDPMKISTFSETLRFYEEMVIPDPDLRYSLKPNATFESDGVVVETNSLGMRDDEPLPAGFARRILSLGDSVVLAVNIRHADTAVKQLEELLGGREKVDVINTAVSSYNTVQQYRLLEIIGDLYQPDLVLLVYVDNDVEMDHEDPYYSADYWNQGVYLPRRLAYYSYIRHPLRLGIRALMGTEPPSPDWPEGQEGWEISRASLKRIYGWCEARDIPFLVVFYPMLGLQLGEAFFDLLADAAAEIGFPLIDSKDFWGDTPYEDIRRSPVDAHMSEAGHALMAEGLARELRARYPELFEPSAMAARRTGNATESL